MAKTKFNLPNDRSNFDTLVRIGGVDYRFLFLWNDRSSKWYFTIYDSAGTKIQGATKFVVNYPLTSLTVSESLFDGSIWAIDTTGSGLEAALRDIGKRVVFVHRDIGG